MALTACGISPICAITGIPRSTKKRTVGAISTPPSIFTAWQPVSAITREALRKACSGLAS